MNEQTPLKIAYLFHSSQGRESGVHKKIAAQVKYWRQSGHAVTVFQITRNPFTSESDNNDLWRVVSYRKPGIRSQFKVYRQVVDAILKIRPDVVYLRYDLFYPALRNLMKKIPTVVEINTDDVREYRIYNRMKSLYNRFTRSVIMRNAGGFVFVTQELAALPRFSDFRRPYRVIANGIDLEDLEVVPPVSNETPHFVFIGIQDQSWHGIDKIIQLAKLKPGWVVHVIGSSGVAGAPGNVTFHGPMIYSDYVKLFAHADAGIGTMALHRKRMDEASPLKVREYLASGLPTIIGYHDTDFPGGAPFILSLPNREDNLIEGIDRIESFVKSWQGKRVSRAQIGHLGANFKEAQRLEFFELMRHA